MSTAASQALVQKLYVAYYGRPADPVGLEAWALTVDANNGQVSTAIVNAFGASAESTVLFGNMSTSQKVNAIYKQLFGRDAEPAGLLAWVTAIDGGRVSAAGAALEILNGATGDDKTTINNKLSAAADFTAALDTTAEIIAYSGDTVANAARSFLAGVTTAAPSTDAVNTAVASVINAGAGGNTFTLTTGTDTFTGTSGNDTFDAPVGLVLNSTTGLMVSTDTMQNVDVLKGGAGIDTLNLTTAGTVALPSLDSIDSIEIINAQSLAALTINTSAVAGVTNLNVIKAAGAVAATAAATTDVGVSVKGIAGTTVRVDGGKDVTINTTDAAATIDAGAAGADVTGAVTITATGAKAANANAAVSLGNISVGGGTTVNVTQKATSDASGLVAGAAPTTHTQGNVTVTAGATTTAVTLKQDAAVTSASTAAVTGVTEVASVKFTKLDAGESVTISGLTFTAATGKNLTADQVAQAFANLSSSAIKPTQITGTPATATGDTQGSGANANGTFTGTLVAGWTSGAATGDTVVFTGKANTAMTDLAPLAKATVTTTTQGVTAVTAQNTLGVTNGTVTIAGAAALKTVTVDGYAASTNLAGITGGTNTALDTISLANGAGFEIDSAAATLGLTLTNVNGTVDVQAGTKTLNAAVSHAKATDATKLVSASAETVNVSGTGNVEGTTGAGAGNLAAATAINTSGMTAGKATFTIANGTTTSYTGGAGVDNVTVTNGNVAITKAIDLGAGDDTLTLNGAVVSPTATLKGGDGIDTIAMNGASAESLSANSTFAGKIEGFEKLSITDKVTVARTVNMANMDGITYVVSNNTTNVAAAATASTFTVDLTGSTVKSTDTVAFNGDSLTASAGLTPAQLALALAGLSYTDWNVKSVAGNVITFEAKNAGVPGTGSAPALPTAPVFTYTDGGSTGGAIGAQTLATTAGAAAGTSPALTIDKMANNGTLELVDGGDGVVVKMADATGSTDSFNIVTKVAGDLGFGTVDVAGVETLKLNAVDTAPGTAAAPTINTASLTVKADKATSLTIEGNSNVTLTLDATTTKLATIDAGTLTGNLIAGNSHAGVNTIAMTITGGKGADQLKASVGTNAKADVLNGGDGNDTLYAGSNGAKLSGGDGNDLFIVTANSATVGNKESNTYSEILDFKAGDLLQLQASDTAGNAAIDVTAFTKLAASLNESTAVFSDFVNAAIKEAGAGAATWFNFKGDAYVVVDSHTNSTGDVFINGEDLVVKLTGINGDNLSWNSNFATVALV